MIIAELFLGLLFVVGIIARGFSLCTINSCVLIRFYVN